MSSESTPHSIPEGMCLVKSATVLVNEVQEHIRNLLALVAACKGYVEACTSAMCFIADDVDKFHKAAVITSLAGNTIGGAGMTLRFASIMFPFLLPAAGIAMAVGSVTSWAATAADSVNTKKKCKEVQKIINSLDARMEDIKACLQHIGTCVTLIQSISDVVLGFHDPFGIFFSKLSALAEKVTSGISLVIAIATVFVAAVMLFAGLIMWYNLKDLKNGAKTAKAAEIRKQSDDIKKIFQNIKDTCEEMKAFLE
ncbi:hypothetical protein FKM82_021514 [Ascaphus truei]